MTNLKINKVMTVEELLMPRYKVIADYPGMDDSYEIGEVLKPAYTGIVDAYPHLFRKLNWWEERKVEDMPEYVKVIANGCSFNAGTILKANNWGAYPDEGNNFGNEGDYYCLLITTEESSTHDKGEEVKMNMRNVLPATEQEYNDYINSNSNAKP